MVRLTRAVQLEGGHVEAQVGDLEGTDANSSGDVCLVLHAAVKRVLAAEIRDLRRGVGAQVMNE